MNAFKTIIYVLVLIALALYIGGFKLSFKPFHIEFNSWYSLVGYILAMIAIAFLNIGTYTEAYKQGATDMAKLVKENIKVEIDSLRKDSSKNVDFNENHSKIPNPN